MIDTTGTDRIEAIRTQAEEMIEAAGFGVSRDSLAATRDTLADFVARWGEGKMDRDIELPHRTWDGIQIGEGTARGRLTVLDFGDWRVANFC